MGAHAQQSLVSPPRTRGIRTLVALQQLGRAWMTVGQSYDRGVFVSIFDIETTNNERAMVHQLTPRQGSDGNPIPVAAPLGDIRIMMTL